MPRTYSFDHFTAARPAVSPWKRASAQEKRAMSRDGRGHGGVHYGHAHARTEELYRLHREEHARQEAMRGPQQSQRARASQKDAASRAGVQEEQDTSRSLGGREGLKELAQGAVQSVLQAAREAARGRPLSGARKLADDAVSGSLRVVREVSARASRLAPDVLKGRGKGPGKGR